MTYRAIFAALAFAAATSFAVLASPPSSAQPQPAQGLASPLRTVESFSSIADPTRRSVALFEEAGRVITHPRCVNCHPVTDRPLQGEDGHPHQPPVFGTASGMGVPGMQCGTCHGRENVTLVGTTLKSVPGHPKWHLAPREMAWQGKSLGEICRQVKDSSRNGGMDQARLLHHFAEDDLVGWAWNPGPGRQPAPGSQETFGLLIKAWLETGAACPG